MKYYQDITLLPDADISLGFIWEKVYQQIHLMLVEHKNEAYVSDIGLSFPAYGDAAFPLGHQLRLFADNESQLADASVAQWLQRLRDYVHIKSIKPVPNGITEYACFSRCNPKSQQQRLKQLDRRVAHLSHKHGVDEHEMRSVLLTSVKKHSGRSQLPYIRVQSLSTPAEGQHRHQFMLFIQCDKSNSAPDGGNGFTCYGLSAKAKGKETFVPWF
ncbi:type I-F CRISPR-associated endoribonuclease Cas6/Csy4 [Vibrio rhizosphaerae]|uniref:Type I-F CRISPR-associated endoribonuclease Cas6/Csy4 n=1 Tax=Vibrio rhizosphaerae TaxID=398736 RepID=A0ABU4IYM0_9VIBR|nr:type I-F CRISPR-associated endoribonuclease Cas6/Csy4 [Vibrio rhizosphaerae]MDW6094242.1 type I-F CRISPR-associated endoribonuclease Cas6/Csy4 [Vibrio rhizosphaerae]